MLPVAPGRDVGDEHDLAPADEEEHLPGLVDLDVVTAVAGLRDAGTDEPRPERRGDDAGRRQPVDVLEGVDGLLIVVVEETVHVTERVVEDAEALLERDDSRAVRPERQRRRLDPGAEDTRHGCPPGLGVEMTTIRAVPTSAVSTRDVGTPSTLILKGSGVSGPKHGNDAQRRADRLGSCKRHVEPRRDDDRGANDGGAGDRGQERLGHGDGQRPVVGTAAPRRTRGPPARRSRER